MADTKQQVLDLVSEMSVMDVCDLVSMMEEKFGVSAAAAVAVAPAAAAGDAVEAAAEGRGADLVRARDAQRDAEHAASHRCAHGRERTHADICR